MDPKFICYYRVSTNRQGTSGLGLEAQRKAATEYANQLGGQIIREFIEVESGKRNNRPKLSEALDKCRSTTSILLIAKLDRLARNVHFISGLLESNVRFVAADMPNADKFMLHVYAAMAEEEGRRISERTKAALSRAKERGVKLGEAAKLVEDRNATRADKFAAEIGPKIARLRFDFDLSFKQIAEELNSKDIPSFRGGSWHQTTVFRVYNRFNANCLT